MKTYYKASGSHTDSKIVEVGIATILGDAIDDLLESGMDEDMHFRGSWDDIEDDDLETAINNSMIMGQVMEYIRPLILKRLQAALEDRRKEHMMLGYRGAL